MKSFLDYLDKKETEWSKKVAKKEQPKVASPTPTSTNPPKTLNEQRNPYLDMVNYSNTLLSGLPEIKRVVVAPVAHSGSKVYSKPKKQDELTDHVNSLLM